MQRVFHDRLIDSDDRTKFKGMMNGKLQTLFSTNWSNLCGDSGRAPLFADFMSEPADEKEQRIYQEIVSKADARRVMEEKIEEMNNSLGAVRTLLFVVLCCCSLLFFVVVRCCSLLLSLLCQCVSVRFSLG